MRKFEVGDTVKIKNGDPSHWTIVYGPDADGYYQLRTEGVGTVAIIRGKNLELVEAEQGGHWVNLVGEEI